MAGLGPPGVQQYGTVSAGNVATWNSAGYIQDGGAGSSSLVVGTTTITSGTTTRVLYDNAGVVGEYTISGSGTVVAMATSPVFTTPTLGVAAGTSLALGGATIGSDVLAWTGSATGSGILRTSAVGSSAAPSLVVGNATTGLYSVSTTGAGLVVNGTHALSYGVIVAGATSIYGSGTEQVRVANTGVTVYTVFRAQSTTVQADSGFLLGSSGDAVLTRAAVATLQHGAADASSAVAQFVRFQSVVAGTADIAGAAATFRGSLSTGTGASGDIIFQTGGKGAASTTQNAAITALTIKGGTTTTLAGSVIIGSAALATTATDGYFYIPTCAGTPTGVPTAVTGRIAMIYDTTNHQFWFYDGAWLQPKTPAAAAIVTWQ